MSSISRFRGGVVQYQAFPTHASYPIELGDLCWVHSDGKAYPAYAAYAVLGDLGSAALNRVGFASRFAGVACQKVGLQTGEKSFLLTTDPGWILLATTGDFEFDCATGISWAPGSRAGVYNDATYNSNQKVCLVTLDEEAIGVAKVPYSALGSTTQLSMVVAIRSHIMLDGIHSGQ
jgi:hypothetical protein